MVILSQVIVLKKNKSDVAVFWQRTVLCCCEVNYEDWTLDNLQPWHCLSSKEMRHSWTQQNVAPGTNVSSRKCIDYAGWYKWVVLLLDEWTNSEFRIIFPGEKKLKIKPKSCSICASSPPMFLFAQWVSRLLQECFRTPPPSTPVIIR